MTHICVTKQTIIGSLNKPSLVQIMARRLANAGILLIGPLGTEFNEILIEIHTFSFKDMHLKMSSGKWRPFCLGLNVLSGILVIHRCQSRYFFTTEQVSSYRITADVICHRRTGSGNVLLTNVNWPFSDPLLNSHHCGPVAFTWEQFDHKLIMT